MEVPVCASAARAGAAASSTVHGTGCVRGASTPAPGGEPEAFSGLKHDDFLKALEAEGIPAAYRYTPLNTQAFLNTAGAGVVWGGLSSRSGLSPRGR
ncbi:exported hypothetical protein [Candidatus Sulfopaludibacter sp. SbA3]|nr:exported hypothetical protein [Candidatus Sulfopaludibacter sp. SbA3]